ncbi:hypothetical protein ACWCYY_18330 [Kitasatospora sp. NPDC001664]
MNIWEKAHTAATVYPMVRVDDGYGDLRPKPAETGTTYRAWVQPVGDAAGWRAPVGAQVGWSPPLRLKLLFPPDTPISEWARVDVYGDRWTVVDPPRRHHGVTDRMKFVTVIVEGGGQDGDG